MRRADGDAPAGGTGAAPPEGALQSFIDRLVAEIAPTLIEYHEATWQVNVTGAAAFAERATALGTRLREVFSRFDAYEFLTGLQAAGGVDEPLLARQLELLVHQHREMQIPPDVIARTVRMEKALEHRFNTHRAVLDGVAVSDNVLRDILRDSDDPALRRRAWEAAKQIGAEVVDDLLALVRLRNESAKHIGYPDHYRMSLELNELDEKDLFEVLDVVDRGTRPLFEAYRSQLDGRLAARFGVDADALRPWHMADPFFQEAPAADVDLDPYFATLDLEDVTARFFDAVGLEVRDALRRSDLYEKPGKCQHAFCISMDRADDVRVLCNLRPDEKWMGTMLHEFGHAAYDVYIDRRLPFLLREPAHTISTEASAMLFGRLSRNAVWLERYANVPRDEARRISAAAREAVRTQLLVATRWILVMCHMERAMYRDPEQDLDTLWWDLVERFQMVRRPDGRAAPDWASKIHFSVAPVYYQNYLLGEMNATQLQRHLLENVLGGGDAARERFVADPAVGRFLRERFYGPGKTREWRAALVHATGEPLRPEWFIDELAGRA